MQLRTRANMLIAAILAAGVVLLTGLHFFAENGQWLPGWNSQGATKSDQIPAYVRETSGGPKQ